MITGFRDRKPWAAIIISLLLSPVTGMLYLNKGRLAGAYFLAYAITLGLLLMINGASAIPHAIHESNNIVHWLLVAIGLSGLVHCCLIAEKSDIGIIKWYARWYGLLLFLSPWIMLIGLRFFYEPFHMPTQSMYPAIDLDDYFFTDNLAYSDSHPPERGDIVVFRDPHKPSVKFVKRIIGLPGEQFQMKQGIVYINNAPLRYHGLVSYVDERTHLLASRIGEILPEGKEIIISHTGHTHVDNTEVYQIPPGHYFIMGDNRDNSYDSRYTDVGYIPRENIIGKAVFVYWDGDDHQFTYRPLK